MANSSPCALRRAAKRVAKLLNSLSLPSTAVPEQQPEERGRTLPRGWSWLRVGAAGWKTPVCEGSLGKGCERRAWPWMAITWGYKLRVVRGINATRVMLGMPNGCKACGEMSRRAGNLCQMSVFLLQTWLAYLIEQNSPLLELLTRSVLGAARSLVRSEPGWIHQCTELCRPRLSAWGCDVGAGGVAVGWVAPVPRAVSLPALLPLGGSVVEEKRADAAQLWAQRAAKARHESFVLLKQGGCRIQRGIFRLDTPRREE